MIMVELEVPFYVYARLWKRLKRHSDVVKEISRSGSTHTTRIFIEDSPRGWWLALKILREGVGKLYILREVKYLEIPSKLMELSTKRKWELEYEKIIAEELARWGLKNE